MVTLNKTSRIGLAAVATQANVSNIVTSISTLATLNNNNPNIINGLLVANLVFNVEKLILATIYIVDTSSSLPTNIKALLTLVPTSISTVTTLTNLIIYNNKNISEKDKKITLYTLTSFGILPNIASLALNSFYLNIISNIA
jgi:hypothetical protein